MSFGGSPKLPPPPPPPPTRDSKEVQDELIKRRREMASFSGRRSTILGSRVAGPFTFTQKTLLGE